MRDGLTEKQLAFVEAYLGKAQGNGTKAAQMAGYSPQNYTAAAVAAHRLLLNPKVREALDVRADAPNDELVAGRNERLAFLSAILRDETEETRDRIRACELLCKAGGDFVERHEHRFADIRAADTADLLRQLPEALAVLGLTPEQMQ